jgi:hypothetical protein
MLERAAALLALPVVLFAGAALAFGGDGVARRSESPPAAAAGLMSLPSPLRTIVPCRMLDTRLDGGPIASQSERDVVLVGPPCGVPADAWAVAANVALFDMVEGNGGVLTVHPAGMPEGSIALINWTSAMGQIDNAAILTLGTAGAVTFNPRQAGGGTVQLVVDITGYFAGSVLTGLIPGVGLSGGGMTGVVSLDLTAGGVTSRELAAASVTTPAIAPGAVGGSQIANGSIGAGKLSAAGSLAGQVLRSSGSEVTWSEPAGGFRRTVVVGPVGTPIENGAALRAANDGIPVASPCEFYALHIEPGVYDLAGSRLMVNRCVMLRGAGVDYTKIIGAGVSFSPYNDSAMSDLTLECSGCLPAISYSIGTAYLERIKVTNSGCTDCRGISATHPQSHVHVIDSEVTVEGSGNLIGIVLPSDRSSITRSRVQVRETSHSGKVGGIYQGGPPGGSSVTSSTVQALGGATNYGISGSRVSIRDSVIKASTATIFKKNDNLIFPTTTTVRFSELSGGPVSGEVIECVAVIVNNVFMASGCQ